eukprot:6209936-Pleurochrysis_carterae.AAC.4
MSLCTSRAEPGCPLMNMRPERGVSFPASRLIRVDLPQPEGPITTVISPDRTSPDASLTISVPFRNL